ncbi:helix-turn-helix domain-containing protein [Peribacillus sp. Hz7]|uniref:helix-turn-helix domain-containing protein n=1 Tax=Peribacillus sp. Hz7 TaxID=3344873 RepID=UPI0035CC5403
MEENKICDYCDKSNTEENLRGDDGVFYDTGKGKYYLYIEHFHNEISRIEVAYCPKCGMKLEPKKTVKRLKKLRIDHGYTIYSLANKLKVDSSSISYWESGKKHPRHKLIIELEDLFGVSYRELFSDLSDEEVKELEQRKNKTD